MIHLFVELTTCDGIHFASSYALRAPALARPHHASTERSLVIGDALSSIPWLLLVDSIRFGIRLLTPAANEALRTILFSAVHTSSAT